MNIPSPPWTAAFLLLLSTTAIAQSWQRVRRQSRNNELLNLKVTCNGLGTCRRSTGVRDLLEANCQCDPSCNLVDTCCIDSPYRNRPKEQSLGYFDCDQPYGATSESVFVVHECSSRWRGEKSVKQQCEGHASSLKDPFLMVPVTDKKTMITYKNYYCYVCNGLDERRNPYFFWEMKLFSDPEMNNNSGPGLYRGMKSGRIPVKDYIFDDYYFYPSAEAPERLRYRVRLCRQNVIGTCAEDWTDAETKRKCESYTSLVVAYKERYKRYRNPHCAICNHEDVSDVRCTGDDARMARGPPYGYLFVGLISMEDKVQRCPRNHVFDTFSSKCRTVRCGATRTMVDGECV